MSHFIKTIIFLHGAGMGPGVWDRLIPHFAQMRCETPALHGASIEEIAEKVKESFKGADERSLLLVGHSMGGLVALAVADHPAVGGIALLGTAAEMPVHPDLLKQAKEDPVAAGELVLKWGLYRDHPEKAALHARLKAIMASAPKESLFEGLFACNAYRGGMDAAQRLQKPLLVIVGADDKMVKPSESQKLSDAAPQGQCQILSETGHMMMVEQPEAVAKPILGFLTLS